MQNSPCFPNFVFQEIGWREFRVFNIFLLRYLELWLSFLAAGAASRSDRRITDKESSDLVKGDEIDARWALYTQ